LSIFLGRLQHHLQLLALTSSKFSTSPKKQSGCRQILSIRVLSLRPGKEELTAIPAESIDYVVMEKCPESILIKMVLLNASWSELGTWDTV
jgi:mannose-1-phosphate guanylyltransferase